MKNRLGFFYFYLAVNVGENRNTVSAERIEAVVPFRFCAIFKGTKGDPYYCVLWLDEKTFTSNKLLNRQMSMLQATTISKSADQVREFIRDVEQAYLLECARPVGIERRSVERMNVTMPVRVTALNDKFEPLDYQYHSVTRNMSPSGVGLVTTNPIGRSHVLLTFEPYHGDIFTVVANVVYCKEVGYYFQIGCEFIAT